MANPSQHLAIGAALALVDRLMRAAFDIPRDPRSEAYKLGAREFLNFKALGRKLVSPYRMGAAEADAYLSGSDEGRTIWQRHVEASADQERTAAPEGN